MSEALVSYAALILADGGQEISASSLSAVLKAADAKVDPVWVETFAKALEGQDIKESLFSLAAAAPAGAAAAAGGEEAASEEKADEEEEEEEEESDSDMGMGLFD